MKKETFLIHYPAGCYGTFVEWICHHFYNNRELNDLPFTDSGSSHKYDGNLLAPAKFKIPEYINSDKTLKFVRTITSIFEEVNSFENNKNNTVEHVVCQDLDYLEQHFKKILVLYPTDQNVLWMHDNVLEKCAMPKKEFDLLWPEWVAYGYNIDYMRMFLESDHDKKLKCLLKLEIPKEKTLQWSKDSIDELEHWELREFLSLYWFERDKDLYSCWSNVSLMYPNIQFISINDLKERTAETIKLIFKHFEIEKYNNKDLNYIVNQWSKCQYHKNKDEDIKLILQHLINNEYFDWQHLQLTILDEAFIQRELRHAGFEIKCYGLDKFPTNTRSFGKILTK